MNKTPMTNSELAKSYDPRMEEPKVLAKWETTQAFHVTVEGQPDQEPYCIVIPPPNVTAALHLGHALNNTLQDVLIRYHRAKGCKTLWMPGTDHAGIATQAVVDKRLIAEGKPSLKDYKKIEAEGGHGREQFVNLVQAWKDQYEATIVEQLKVMGCSCDWERIRFTMDEMCARSVREAFFRLFRDGLIYRGKRLVNWDPVLQTAVADDECFDEEIEGFFYYLRYPLVGEPVQLPDGAMADHVTVATTRPETMLGDTAVAVNPRDPRAQALVGRRVKLPLVNREIPIIADDYVVLPVSMGGDENDPKAVFATGFLKVTPAHDPNDWEIGQRHHLEAINIFAPDASISDQHGWGDVGDAGFLVGLDREEARRQIVKRFETIGILREKKPYTHSVAHSDRSKAMIEPYLSDQWYVKVTDDRLSGNALRAMAQRSTSRADEPPASPKRERQAIEASPKRERRVVPGKAFLLTWTTYGAWLHGDERGSVDRLHNTVDSPLLPPDAQRENRARYRMKSGAFTLDDAARRVVCRTIQEVCKYREWTLLAINVRTNHVHCVVSTNDEGAGEETQPEKVLVDFKAWGTRRLTEAGVVKQGSRVWTQHGSTRWIHGEGSVVAACEYVLTGQGANTEGAFGGEMASSDEQGQPGAHAWGSLESRGADAGGSQGSRVKEDWQGALRFYPERYARTFESWHENIRDWCISRQLWWGHRIPVWRGQDLLEEKTAHWEREGRIAVQRLDSEQCFICVRDPDRDNEIVEQLERWGFERDPDVLDTWFSSALWPLSTMGWPTPDGWEATKGRDGQPCLLDQFNPTDVLCTAREIITLWVSRMVMFNLYFTGEENQNNMEDGRDARTTGLRDTRATEQRLPFRDVFIHAMIQDGEGRKMSKSLGNGVDPRDIIRSKGADAMRFTLTQMTTQTQDVRMPVEFDREIGANTSPKFELGRRLCNKLWNATRFALMQLNTPAERSAASESTEEKPHSLADRWILSRLFHATWAIEDAINQYEFSQYAQLMYDLFWRDFCDWYLEAIKPTVKSDFRRQQVLRAALGCIVRLFHPIMPMITETLHESVEAIRVEPFEGVELPPSDLAATARWPIIDLELADDEAEATFERVRALVSAIREVRSLQKVHDKRTITLHINPDEQAPVSLLLDEADGIVQTLAGVSKVTAAKIPEDGVRFIFENFEMGLSDLTDHVNVEAERSRLVKQQGDLVKRITGLEGRLANSSYLEKAPAKLVEESKQQLDASRMELSRIIQALEEFGPA